MKHFSIYALPLIALMAGCNSSSQPQSGSSTAPTVSNEVLQSVQNPAGCLDVPRLMKRFEKMKNRMSVSDLHFESVPSDLVLTWMVETLDNPSNATPSDDTSSSDSIQNDCTSLIATDSKGNPENEFKIIESNSHSVRAEGFLDPETKKIPYDEKYELISDNQISFTVQTSLPKLHNCDGKEITEQFSYTSTFIFDFGDKISAPPKESAELKMLRKKAKLASAKIINGDNSQLEKDFCASVNH